MRVYHFVSAVYGLENLQFRRLKIARVNELNDPFEFMARASNSLERAALRATKDQQSAKTGLLCFSESWKNSVQWSHYADRHRGMCLGFDVPDEHIQKVTYRKSPIRFDVHRFQSDGIYAEEFSKKLVSTKFYDWSYEKEWRLYIKLDLETEIDGKYFYKFSDDLRLAEVIVGSASLLTRSQVATALGTLAEKVRRRKARMAFNSFRVVEQLNPRLWT